MSEAKREVDGGNGIGMIQTMLSNGASDDTVCAALDIWMMLEDMAPKVASAVQQSLEPIEWLRLLDSIGDTTPSKRTKAEEKLTALRDEILPLFVAFDDAGFTVSIGDKTYSWNEFYSHFVVDLEISTGCHTEDMNELHSFVRELRNKFVRTGAFVTTEELEQLLNPSGDEPSNSYHELVYKALQNFPLVTRSVFLTAVLWNIKVAIERWPNVSTP